MMKLSIATMPAERPIARGTVYPWYALSVLMIVGLFAVIDRLVFIIQAEDIRQFLRLSDTQLGALQGLGVSLFTGLAMFPAAWLADRYDRRLVLAGCIVFWSLAVVACGFAQNFTSLLIASALVGAGEAGLAPVAFAMIPELFEGSRRQVANSTFTASGRLGYGLGLSICGYIVLLATHLSTVLSSGLSTFEPWRITFFLAAAPAPLLVMLLMGLRPSRPAVRTRESRADMANPELRFVVTQRAPILCFTLGQSFVLFSHAALLISIPIVALRQFGGSASSVGNWFGAAITIATIAAMIITSLAVPRMVGRWGRNATIAALIMTGMLAVGTCIALLLAKDTSSLSLIYALYLAFDISLLMIIPTIMQDIVPAVMRARMVAVTFGVAIIPAGLSQVIVGSLSDALGPLGYDLLSIVVMVSASGLTLATIAFLILTKWYSKVASAACEYNELGGPKQESAI
jgi:MFS family permease